MSQLIIDLISPATIITPIIAMNGEDSNGWFQGSTELAYKRAGPERWLTNLCLVCELVAPPWLASTMRKAPPMAAKRSAANALK